MNAILALPEAHACALRLLLTQVPPDQVLWALTGSTALRLYGVDVPVHDLDVQSTTQGVIEIALRMGDTLRQAPAWSERPRVRSCYGTLEVCQLKVELMGDIQHLLPDGSWSQVIDIAAYRRWLSWHGVLVPVLDLAYEAQAYEELGRTEKAAMIRAALARSYP